MARKSRPIQEATQKVSDGKDHVKASTEHLMDKATELGHRAEQALESAVDKAETAASKNKRSPGRRRLWSGAAGGLALVLVAINRRRK